MSINIWHVIGILSTLILIAIVGLYSGSKVKNAKDFTTGGGKAGSWLVCGGIMGSLVGGQATIGTAQLAFSYGASAWWFTLGSGIGCLILGIAYAIPLRRDGSFTLMQVISKEYGEKAGYIGTVLCSIGIFISIIAQVISASALLTTLFPIGVFLASLIAVILMMIYVVFGGAWGAGMGGIVKLVLLYVASIAGCGIVLYIGEGAGNLMAQINHVLQGTPLGAYNGLETSEEITRRYLSLVARGPMKDIGSCVSLLLGVLSTQTYAQAIWSGKSDSVGRKGAFFSALLIPPIGIACTLIGLFMRGRYITSEEMMALKQMGEQIPVGMKEIASTSQVFPLFIVDFMPALLGGVVLGTLFITVVGGGAGLSLGVATIVVNDILKKVSKKINTPEQMLIANRGTIVCVLVAAMVIALMVPGAIINDIGFLSMGLRGTVVFLPLTLALFYKGKVSSETIVMSMVAGPIGVIIGNIFGLPIDSLFVGMMIQVLIVFVGRKRLAKS